MHSVKSSRGRDDEPSFHPRALWSSLVDLVFPPVCQVCGQRSCIALCAACLQEVQFLEPPWCPRCGRPFPPLATGEGECADCRNHRRAFDLVRCVGPYEDPLRECVTALKYRGRIRLAEDLGRLLARRLEATLTEADVATPDCVVPVPLHWRRRWRRGYNQSLLLGRELARAFGGLELAPVLVRRRHTRPQTKLDRRARLANLRGAFSLRRHAKVAGKHVLVVDDVMTTGATLNECAKVLKRARCAGVMCLTVCRQAAR